MLFCLRKLLPRAAANSQCCTSCTAPHARLPPRRVHTTESQPWGLVARPEPSTRSPGSAEQGPKSTRSSEMHEAVPAGRPLPGHSERYPDRGAVPTRPLLPSGLSCHHLLHTHWRQPHRPPVCYLNHAGSALALVTAWSGTLFPCTRSHLPVPGLLSPPQRGL